jgi:siroheme synthase-like protein
MKHRYMPVSVAMQGRRTLVVGGGAVALRKVENLLDYDADISVVAVKPHEKLKYHAEHGRIRLEERAYRPPEAGDYGLVFAATDDGEVNQRVYEDATDRGVLVNTADDPPRCAFIVPAVLRRDCLSVAVTTEGQAPFMAGHLRLVLDEVFPEHWERLMKLAARFRGRVRERWPEDDGEKSRCFAEFLEADWRNLMAEMDDNGIEKELSRIIENTESGVKS